MNGAIEISDLTLGYERHPAVHHLCGVIAAGSLTAVVGPNGGGKSTLLKGIMGLLPAMEGNIRFRGLGRGDIAYLPQQAEIDCSFPISVMDTVLMGHWHRVGSFRSIGPELRAQASSALVRVGLEGFEARQIGSLSAGQRQRVLFARLVVADAPVILLDEPFTAMDQRTTTALLSLVLDWHGEGRTVVAVLHDHDQVRRYFPRTLLLARELIAHGPTVEVLAKPNLARATAMSEAWDVEAAPCERGAA